MLREWILRKLRRRLTISPRKPVMAAYQSMRWQGEHLPYPMAVSMEVFWVLPSSILLRFVLPYPLTSRFFSYIYVHISFINYNQSVPRLLEIFAVCYPGYALNSEPSYGCWRKRSSKANDVHCTNLWSQADWWERGSVLLEKNQGCGWGPT